MLKCDSCGKDNPDFAKYYSACGEAVQEKVKFCHCCGRRLGDDTTVTRPSIHEMKEGMSITTIAVLVVAVVIAVAAIGLSSLSGSSATLRVTVSSTASLSTNFKVYFDDSLIRSGSLQPYKSVSFEHTHRWSSSEPTIVELEVASSDLMRSYYDNRTITVSDGGYYAIYLIF